MSETKKAMNYELLFMQAVGLLGVINAHYMCIESYIHNIFNYYTWLMAFFIFLSGLLFARKALRSASVKVRTGFAAFACAFLKACSTHACLLFTKSRMAASLT